MKNIQVIDSGVNCRYDIFSAEDDLFKKIFPQKTDIQFYEDLVKQLGERKAHLLLENLWKNRQNKKKVIGIHGTLFYGLLKEKKKFYPTNKENEMIANPD